MKFSELKAQKSYAQIVSGTTLSRNYLCQLVKRRGFSASAVRRLQEKYPDLDATDLLQNYPMKQ